LTQLSACREQVEPTAAKASIDNAVEAVLTPELADEFRDKGYLIASTMTLPADGISEERAVSLATALIGQFVGIFQPTIERQAGRGVWVKELVAEERVIFAETPYQPLHVSENSLRAWAGPAYIVIFADRFGPAVAVSVSAHARSVKVVDGRLVFPTKHGNEFKLVGIDPSRQYGPVFSAEEAAVDAAGEFGVRVASAPSFVWHGVSWFPTVGASGARYLRI
jgi:hypothetical protein